MLSSEQMALRAANPILRRRTYFQGQPIPTAGTHDLTWLHADGHEMTVQHWHDTRLHSLALLLNGEASDERDEHGRPVTGETVLFLLNAGGRPRRFVLPRLAQSGTWAEAFHSGRYVQRAVKGDSVTVMPHACVLLRYEALA